MKREHLFGSYRWHLGSIFLDYTCRETGVLHVLHLKHPNDASGVVVLSSAEILGDHGSESYRV